MTKADLIDKLVHEIQFSKTDAAELVENFFESIKETLAFGDDVKISGFGTWKLRDKDPRVGRNPQSGKELEISARRVVTWKPSPIMKEKINGK